MLVFLLHAVFIPRNLLLAILFSRNCLFAVQMISCFTLPRGDALLT